MTTTKPETMNDDLWQTISAAFDADEVADACAALLRDAVGIRKLSRVPRHDGRVNVAALTTAGVPLWVASGLASQIDPQGAAPTQSAPTAPLAVTVRLYDDDPRKMPPRAFLTYLAEHHAEDPSLVAWADAEHPLCSTRGVVATATGIDVEATAGAEGLWSQRRDLRGETWLDQRVTTAADALTPAAEEEHDPVTGAALQRGLNPATRVSWAKVSRHDRGFAAWLAQGQSASVVRRDDGTRIAEAASAGGLAGDGVFGPLLRLYADAAKRDPDLARRSEAAAYRRPAPPSGGATQPPFAAGAEAPSGPVDARALREALSALYSDAANIRRVAGEAGIPLSRIDASGPAQTAWFSVVGEAAKTGHVGALLAVALREYPSNPALRALAAPPAAARINWQKLTVPQWQELQSALLSAFTARAALARIVRGTFDDRGETHTLDSIAGGGGLRDVTGELIQWTQARGHTRRLFDAAREENPTNAALLALAARA